MASGLLGGEEMDSTLVQDIVGQVMKALDELKENSQVIPVEASARHVHLSQKDIDKLFGAGYKMIKKKDLSQPGQYQCEERVTLIGPRGVIKGVAVLGPPRSKTQVEISKTDARTLGVSAPIRESGQLIGSASMVIATEGGVVESKESTIVAKRHIHMKPEEANRLAVRDQQIVAVKVTGDRPLVFHDVVVRVHEQYQLSMHIDYDEANAVGYQTGAIGEILP